MNLKENHAKSEIRKINLALKQLYQNQQEDDKELPLGNENPQKEEKEEVETIEYTYSFENNSTKKVSKNNLEPGVIFKDLFKLRTSD